MTKHAPKISFKFFVILAMLAATGFFAWRVYFKTYTQQDTVSIHNYPRQIGLWVSRDLKITEDEYAILETRNVFVREYTHQETKRKAYLFIVYSENNRKVSHPPEICYTGSGFAVVESSPDSLRSATGLEVPTVRLHLELGQAEQLAHYWFKVGGEYTRDYWAQQVKIVLNTLFGKPASSALIRVSADVYLSDYDQAEQIIDEFSAVAIPHLLPHLP